MTILHSYKKIIFFGIFLLLFIALPLILLAIQSKNQPAIAATAPIIPTSTPTPDKSFSTYTKPALPKRDMYNIYLIGDSMTHALGPRGGRFTEVLSDAYPDTFFEVSNYAVAGQNIESLDAYLHKTVSPAPDMSLNPIYDGDPQVIILESFGYNPLSHLGLEGGLARQAEVLTQLMEKLTQRFPNSVILFLSTIAPDRDTYGRKVLKSSIEGSREQADERISYIKNHSQFATDHNIPLINVYQDSLDTTGDGDTKYINPDDNIHPSAEGLELMSQTMTRRIQEETIFPR